MNETLTNQEVFLLLEKSPGQAVMKHEAKPVDEKKVKRLIDQLGYEYSFVFIFAPAVKALYPIITHLIQNMDIPKDVSKESIVYLTISTIGILLSEPKSKYASALKRVKDDGLYRFIKPILTSLKGMKSIFTFISNRIGKVITSYAEMFAYTALFVPFALIFKDIIQNDANIMGILDAFSNNTVGNVISTGVGVSIFAAKHFIEDILNGLKSFRDMGISGVKNVIDKIKAIKLPKFSKNENRISRYSEYQNNFV